MGGWGVSVDGTKVVCDGCVGRGETTFNNAELPALMVDAGCGLRKARCRCG